MSSNVLDCRSAKQ